MRTLWDALNEIEDLRGRKGRQYALRAVLGISLAAMLAGANDLLGIFRWGRRLKPEALRLFGIETGKAPCHATYHYFFQSLDADALSRTLGSFALKQGKAEHIAIDGKTLRGSRRLDDKAVHVLSAFATGLGGRHRRSDGRTRSERDHRCARFAERTATGRPHHYGRRDVHPARDLPPYPGRQRPLSLHG